MSINFLNASSEPYDHNDTSPYVKVSQSVLDLMDEMTNGAMVPNTFIRCMYDQCMLLGGLTENQLKAVKDVLKRYDYHKELLYIAEYIGDPVVDIYERCFEKYRLLSRKQERVLENLINENGYAVP